MRYPTENQFISKIVLDKYYAMMQMKLSSFCRGWSYATLLNVLVSATVIIVCIFPGTTQAVTPSESALVLTDDVNVNTASQICEKVLAGESDMLNYAGSYNVQGVFPGTFDTAEAAIEHFALEFSTSPYKGSMDVKDQYNATGATMKPGKHPKEYTYEAIYTFPANGERQGFGELNETMKMWAYSTSAAFETNNVSPCIGSWFVVDENGQVILQVAEYTAGVPWGAWEVMVVDDLHKCTSKNPTILLLNDSGLQNGSVMLMYNTFGEPGYGYELWTPQ